MDVKGQINSILRCLYIILEPCLKKEKKWFQVFPCADCHEKIWFTTQKILKSNTQQKCVQTPCVFLNPKGDLKEQKNCESSIERPSTTVSHKGRSVKLNYLEYPVNQKGDKVEISLSFPLDKAGGNKTYKKEASKSLSISSVFLCFPTSFSSSPRWAVCIFTWSHCSAFQGG